jgi:transcriptional regulator with XRE-family HTH domain
VTVAPGSLELPIPTWERTEVREALHRRDMGAVFQFVQQHGGASQARIGTAVGMTQARVNEIINGRREVSRLDVYERIANGLNMPDSARCTMGLAASGHGPDRSRTHDLLANPEIARIYAEQSAARSEIREHASTAHEIDVLAVRGLGLVGLKDSLLRACMSRKSPHELRVRVLLLNPDSPALRQRASEIGESAQSLSDGIRLAEARIGELGDQCRVEVYRYNHLPTWRIIRTDNTLFVGAFDESWEGHKSVTYKITRNLYGPLHRGFIRMVEAMINESERTV